MKKNRLGACGIMFVALAAAFVPGAVAADKQDSIAVFGVACYDVGTSALKGLAGVKEVSSGWRGFTEINIVVYDGALITVEQMEEALRKTGTYRSTLR